MKRWCATLLAVIVCSAVVHGEVTIIQKTTMEGGPAQAMGAGAAQPTMTNRIKGMKGRMDMDMTAPMPMSMSTITDLGAKQVIVLQHAQKTAQTITPGATAATTTTTAPTGTLKVDGSVTPTGKTQVIDGYKCEEFVFSSSIDMSEMGGGANMPPEAAAAMKGIKMIMKGSMWVTKEAPGIAEYRAFNKASADANLSAAAMRASGLSAPGMEKVAKAMASVDGITILSEMSMTVEGAGQMADMMRQMMGSMKVIQRVTSINTDAIADDQFKVPEGYAVIK